MKFLFLLLMFLLSNVSFAVIASADVMFPCALGEMKTEHCWQGPNDVIGKCVDKCSSASASRKQIMENISCYIPYFPKNKKVCDRSDKDKKEKPVCISKNVTLEQLFAVVGMYYKKSDPKNKSYLQVIEEAITKIYSCSKE